MRPLLLLPIVLLLAGCGQLMPDSQVTEFTKQYIEAIRTRDFDAIEARIDPKLKDTQLRPTIEKIAGLFPSEQAKAVDLIAWRVGARQKISRYELRFKYDYPSRPLRVDIIVDRQGDRMEVKGFHVFRPGDDFAATHAFTFRGKPAHALVLLAYAVAVPIVILWALIACIRMSIPWWKWLWCIFIVLGFGKVTLNWTTGAVDFQLLNVQLLGSGFETSAFDPILIVSSLPVGALAFLLYRRHRLSAAGNPAPPPPAD